MRKSRWASTVVALLLAATALGPAAAAGTATKGPITLTTEGGFVAPSACQEGPPRFKLVVDETQIPDYDDWSADITITGPSGYYDTDFLWDEEGWNRLWFCKSPNRAGIYTVTAEVEIEHYNESSGYYSTFETVSASLRVKGPAKSSVTFRKKPYRAHGWKFLVRVARAGKAWSGRSVAIQAKCNGSWYNVKKKTTNRKGRVVFTAEPQAGAGSKRVCGVRLSKLWFRFYVKGNWNTKPDSSKRFHIRRR